MSEPVDVIVVGAGAAGLMAAISAAEGGLQVLLLEGQPKPGAKILMSGGTRCNVTNKSVSEKDFNSTHLMQVRDILRAFNNTQTIKFFKDLDVELVLEPTGKYFPSTNSGKTVLEALLRKLNSYPNIQFSCGHKVRALKKEGQVFHVSGEGFHYKSSLVVLTTGGLSYPTTGSDGTGYRLAQGFGHGLIETMPALTPLTTADEDFKSLSGVTLDVILTLRAADKKVASFRDSFLFTHLGFSGPAALDISRHWLKEPRPKQILVNFMPTYNEESLQAHWRHLAQSASRKTLKTLLTDALPQRLAEIIFKKTGIEPLTAISQLDKTSRQRLVAACVNYPLDVTGVVGYSKAEVTAGGIDWDGLYPKTLESKFEPGLYFAGEILDVDGRIGGFNFQWAWASGHTVGQAMIKRKRELHEQKDH